MAETKEPLLDLDDLVERPMVKIRGQLYAMRNPEEMSPFDHYRIAKRMDSVSEALTDAPKAPDKLEATMAAASKTLDAVCREILVDVPEDVHAALYDSQRIRIAQGFLRLLREHAVGLVRSIGGDHAAEALQRLTDGAPAPVEAPAETSSIGGK